MSTNKTKHAASKHRLLLAVVLGLAGFAASFLSPTFQIPPHTISITWCHIFPLMVAMAYGPRYGLLAGTAGLVAFYPFVAYPRNGWANIFVAIFMVFFYLWHGYCAMARRRQSVWWNQPLLAQIPYAIAYGAGTVLLYPLMFSFNPPFWSPAAPSQMPGKVITSIALKSTLTMYGCVLTATFLLMMPAAKRLLSMPSPRCARFNGKVFLASIASMAGVWLLWQTLNSIFVAADFPQGIVRFGSPAQTVTLLVIVTTCLVSGYVVTLFVEKRYAVEESLQQSEMRFRILFEAANDAIFVMRDRVIIDCNAQTSKMFRCARSDILGRSPVDFSPERQPNGRLSTEEAAAKIAAVLSGHPQRFEWQHIGLDHTPFEVEVSLSQIELGHDIFIQAIVRDITERKRIQRELLESHAHTRAIINSTNDMIWSVDTLRFGLLIFNRALADAMFRSYGVRIQIGMTPSDILPPDRAAVWPEYYQRAIDHGAFQTDYEVPAIGALLELAFCPIVQDGQIGGIAVFAKNVTERKRAETALQASERRLDLAFSLARAGAWEVDLQTKQVTLDPKPLRNLGYEPGEIPSTIETWTKLVHPDDGGRVTSTFEDFLRGNTASYNMEYRVLRKDGSWAWTEVYGTIAERTTDGIPRRLVGAHIDITERKRVEVALRDGEDRFRQLANAAFEGILFHDQGIILDANRVWAELFGFESAEGLIGRNLFAVLPLTEDSKAVIRERTRLPDTGVFEISAVLPDGNTRILETRGRGYVYQGRNARVVTVHDITLRKQSERLMVESEKLRTVAGLAASVAHEINNPLAGMVQNAQVIVNRLTQEMPANQQAAERYGTTFTVIRNFIEDREIPAMLESIRSSGRQASHIVQNLLAYSRKDQGSNTADLAELVERTLELAVNDYELKNQDGLGGVEIVRELSPDTPATLCNANQIQQVLLNLIRNAVQAMRANPAGRPPRLYVRTHNDNGRGCIEVEDNGPGIVPEHRGRLFEPFFSTKPAGEGTGLGLFVCYHIVTVNHGGQIAVDSPPGKGTCFRITLPLSEGQGVTP